MIKTHQLEMVRKAFGMSQTELAERLGVTTSFVAQIEKGKRNMPDERRYQINELLPITEEEIEFIEELHQRIKR